MTRLLFEFVRFSQQVRYWLSLHSRRLRLIALVIAVILYAAGLFWAFRTAPDLSGLRVAPIFFLLIAGVPLVTALNVAEFQLMSRIAGRPIGWFACLEISIFASVTNMLPLPGGIVTRVVALTANGAPLRRSSMIIGLFSGIWGSMSFGYSGAWLIYLGHGTLGWSFAAAGGGLLALCLVAVGQLRIQRSLWAQMLAIRSCSMLIDILRQMAAIWALGILIDFADASVLAVSTFVGSALSIVPAGLSVREFAVAALASLIALPPATGFLSATIIRIVDMAGLATFAVILLIAKRKTSQS